MAGDQFVRLESSKKRAANSLENCLIKWRHYLLIDGRVASHCEGVSSEIVDNEIKRW